MKKGIYVLPNLVTVCSTFCGFYAIVASFKEDYVYAAWAIMIASIFDGLDGKIARLADARPFNQLEIQRLKKRKLALKDRIIKIENDLLPDIIA